MIEPLRRLHRRVWIVLAVLLPLLMLAAVAWRRSSTPVNANFEWEQPR
jgi:hypothetical protein